MRDEATMYKLFMDIANSDNRILALYMNGSRTNVNVPKDIFQDYDIVFVVTQTKTFIEDKNWIYKFGNILYMQYPDEHPDFPNDKENILPNIPQATDENYHIKRPLKAQFKACINEFWWCSNNLAKGLWREEITYVQDMANFIVRKELEKMLSWKVGIQTNFSVSVGKSAKYLYKWLDKSEYECYINTYFNGNIENAWKAIFLMCDLFDCTSKYVSKKLGYTYNIDETKAALEFLKHVKCLPKNADKVY